MCSRADDKGSDSSEDCFQGVDWSVGNDRRYEYIDGEHKSILGRYPTKFKSTSSGRGTDNRDYWSCSLLDVPNRRIIGMSPTFLPSQTNFCLG
jgi:hypothetical protein